MCEKTEKQYNAAKFYSGTCPTQAGTIKLIVVLLFFFLVIVFSQSVTAEIGRLITGVIFFLLSCVLQMVSFLPDRESGS